MASLTDALVKQLLGGRYIASIATQNPDGSIPMVAVWLWFDGSHVFVGKSSRSRKARNVQSKPTASLMIDARDPVACCGVPIAGSDYLLTDDTRGKRIEKFTANT
jgi:hypothetical protein